MEQATRNFLGYRSQPTVMTEKMVFLLKLRGGLDKNLDKTNLNAELMAKEMEMSKSTLNRKLKSILNQGIKISLSNTDFSGLLNIFQRAIK